MTTETQIKPKFEHLCARLQFYPPPPSGKQLQNLCDKHLPIPGKLMDLDGSVLHRVLDRDKYEATWRSTEKLTENEYEMLAWEIGVKIKYIEMRAAKRRIRSRPANDQRADNDSTAGVSLEARVSRWADSERTNAR